MVNLDSILKSRDSTLLTKVHIVKAMVFPVVTFRCESWTIKKAKRWRIDMFKLWWWRTLLEVPWTTRRWKQLILKGIYPEYSLEGWCWSWSSNTLSTWCEESHHWEKPRCWQKAWRQKEKGAAEGEMVEWHHRLIDMSLCELWETVEDREISCAAELDTT